MANWISNNVTALNDAAKDFTRKHVVDEEGNFCFSKLVPVPDILAKIEDRYPRPIVSPEELQAFKAKHQKAVHCEFEQEGLLYTLDEDGELEKSVYTEACNEHVIEQYDCDNYLDYRIKVWGCKNEIGDCETEDEDDTLSYDFSTAWDAPMAFMLKLAAACPEGQWQWSCEAEGGTDWLVFELNQGEVIITEHGIDEEYVESVDDIYWNDRGEVPGVNDIENDTALIPGEVFSVNPNYKVVLDD